MNSKDKGISKRFLIVISVLFCMGLVIAGATYFNASSDFIANQSQTLSPIGSAITSSEVKANNQTWLNLGGSGEYVKIDDSDSLSEDMYNWTFAYSVNRTGIANGVVLGKYTPFQIGIDDSNRTYSYIDNGTSVSFNMRTATNSMVLNKKVSVIWEIDRSDDSTQYINGSISGTQHDISAYEGQNWSFGSDLYIGKRDSGSAGIIENVSLYYVKAWNRLLNHNEIEYVSRDDDPNGVLWIAYHAISPSWVSSFNNTLISLNNSGYTSWTALDYWNWTQGQKELPSNGRAVVFTFDDGTEYDYNTSKIMLDEYGYVATTYVVTNRTENIAGFMNWSQIQELADDGWEIGSHTVTHTNLLLGGLSEAQIIDELNNSKIAIEGNLTGVIAYNFAYPQGGRNTTIDALVAQFYLTSPAVDKPYFNYKDALNRNNNNFYNLGRYWPTSGVTVQEVQDATIGAFDNLSDSVLRLNLNENNGTIANDASGNSNDGTITGATWATDGILITLTELTDYTLSTTTGLFTITNDDYLYSWVNASWTYVVNETDCDAQTIAILELAVLFLALAVLLFGIGYAIYNQTINGLIVAFIGLVVGSILVPVVMGIINTGCFIT